MNNNLLLVESPSKAKTIGKYLGKEWTVLATLGHVRQLPSKSGSIEPEKDFEMHYEIIDKSQKNLNSIIHYIIEKNSNVNVFLATDPDREGEAISWHVVEIMKANKKIKFSNLKIKRVVFNAITKDEVKKAIANPRDIDSNLVDAQRSRLALDYLVGYTISPILWRTVGGAKASGGRVQSVALRLMSERELEILQFKPQEYWSIHGAFDIKKISLNANLIFLNNKKIEKFSFKNEDEAKETEKIIQNQSGYMIHSIEQKQQNKNPYPPFTTSSLQQEASKRLNFTSKKTMSVAQKLYEGVTIHKENLGLITYMRTDGVYVTDDAIKNTRDVIKNLFGAKYLPNEKRIYNNKIKNAQEAHEAIRPTQLDEKFNPDEIKEFLTSDEFALYKLIWNRMIASQMASAIYDIANVMIVNEDYQKSKIEFKSTFSNISFEGFLKVYGYTDDDENIETKKLDLSKLSANEKANLDKIEKKQHFTEPPARYSEAALIKKMEEIGIGRPSTYASIISTLQMREYIILKQKRFFVTIRGHVITNFLVDFFSKYFAYDFTANMENELDDVASGNLKWKILLKNFWSGFDENAKSVLKVPVTNIIEDVSEKMKNYLFFSENDDRCPICKEEKRENGKLSLKFSKFGYFLGCSNYPTCNYVKSLSETLEGSKADDLNSSVIGGEEYFYQDENVFVKLKKGRFGNYFEVENKQTNEKKNIGLSEKILKELSANPDFIKQLIQLPIHLGVLNEEDVKLNLGQYGFYISHGKNFASLSKISDPFSVTFDEALDLLNKNLERIENNTKEVDLNELGILKIQRGGFGKTYLIHEGVKVVLPKDIKFAEIDEQLLKNFYISLINKKKKKVRSVKSKT